MTGATRPEPLVMPADEFAAFRSVMEAHGAVADAAVPATWELHLDLRDKILAIIGEEDGKPEPLSAACTGPGCGEQFADSETGEYLFATRERMGRLLSADGWQAGPVLCPACQEEAVPGPADPESAGQLRLPGVAS